MYKIKKGMGKKLHFKRNGLYLEDLTLEDLT